MSEPEHAIPARYKPITAPAVVTKTEFEVMTLAIDLDVKLARMCDEIRDIIAHRALSAKSKKRQPMCFQVPPQRCFRARHGASWPFGAGSPNLADLIVWHTSLPEGGREKRDRNRIARNHSFPITSLRKP
jgi:hypothetical protein